MSNCLKLFIALLSTSAFVYAADAERSHEDSAEKSQWVQERDAAVAVVEREAGRIADQAADAAPVIEREAVRIADQAVDAAPVVAREAERIGKQIGRLFGRR